MGKIKRRKPFLWKNEQKISFFFKLTKKNATLGNRKNPSTYESWGFF